LSGKRSAMLSSPVNMSVVANLEEEIQLFREERVVVFKIETEERKSLD
jgi:hypothetical protein